jgi:hypothetical protein
MAKNKVKRGNEGGVIIPNRSNSSSLLFIWTLIRMKVGIYHISLWESIANLFVSLIKSFIDWFAVAMLYIVLIFIACISA